VDEDFRKWAEKRDREHREFLDALTERHVGITQRMIATIERLEQRMTIALAALQAEIADQREQIQANTQALLTVLDRFEPGRG
jgi:predicted  nucleic acid-binding Zn-ribbon protein